MDTHSENPKPASLQQALRRIQRNHGDNVLAHVEDVRRAVERGEALAGVLAAVVSLGGLLIVARWEWPSLATGGATWFALLYWTWRSFQRLQSARRALHFIESEATQMVAEEDEDLADLVGIERRDYV